MGSGFLLSFIAFTAEFLTVFSALVIYVVAKNTAKNPSFVLKMMFLATAIFAFLSLLFPVPYLFSVPAAFSPLSAAYVVSVILLFVVHMVVLRAKLNK